MEYLPHLCQRLTEPLKKQGTDGVAEVISLLDEYDLIREDFNNIVEISHWHGKPELMANIDSKVSSLYLNYHKVDDIHALPGY